MTWTTCPRCEGEAGDWCGGQCHEGGLYICEACGNAEEDNSEECPRCGKVDEDMRLARLKAEAEDAIASAAAELYALESGDHDKAALRAAFLAGVQWVGEPTVNADLLEALEDTLVELKEFQRIFGVCVSHGERMGGWLEEVEEMITKIESAIAKTKGGAA